MFQKIIDFSIRNKLAVAVLTLLVAVWGAVSLVHLPFDSTPDITNNQVQIITQAPSLGAQEVEQFITTPMEMALANIPRVEERRSISRSGLSVVTLVFDDNADIYWARQQVSQQLGEAEESIPEGAAKVEMAPISTGLGEIFHYTIRPKKGYEDRYSLTDIRTLQDWVVRKQLAGTPGVAEVNGWGGFVKQYEVAIDAERLNSAGVTVGDVFTAIEDGNENTGGSYIEQFGNSYFIRGIGMARTLDDLRRIPVRNVGGTPILVGDVADVRLGSATRFGAVTRNGEGEVVAGITLMLKGENFQEVIKNVKERIAQIQKSLPEGVVIEPFIDRTQLVSRVTGTIARNLIEGGLIVVFILVLFLGNVRAGLVVASVIPLSMLFAFGMMGVFGVSGNLMSLGAIDFGLIVDGAVIIVESICHFMTTRGAPAGNGSATTLVTRKEMDGIVSRNAGTMMGTAAFGELIIMTVYVPLFTLVGIEGKMFRPMALTVFFAILGAFLLSLTYVPVASSLLLSRKTTHKQNLSDRMMARITAFYRPLLEKSLKHSRAVIATMVVVLCGCGVLFSQMGGEFIPNLEEGDFAAEMSMKQGTSLSQMIKTCSQAEAILKQFPEVKQAVSRIGSSEIPTDPMPVERADVMIALTPKDTWTTAKTQAELMEKMEEALAVIPGLNVEMSQPIQMRTNELVTGIKQDVAIMIYGPDLDKLSASAKRVASLIRGVEGVTEPVVERVSGLPQLQVTYDRNRLAQYGISVRTANRVLSTAFAGAQAGVVYEEDRSFDIVVRMDEKLRNDISSLRSLLIPLPDGGSVPLGQLADIDYRDAPSQITHDEGQRRIYVGFNVRGRDVERTIGEIEQILTNQLHLPEGYYYAYGGQFKNLDEAKGRLAVAVPGALAIILLLLYVAVKSVRETLIVFTAVPLSAIGGVLALWLRGMPFSISAGVGFIALFGVVVLNGLVLISQFNRFEREGMTDVRQRTVEGCLLRLRPVIMTALVASLGFLPMALSTGDGAEVQRPLATVVIGGLITATILTLFVLPCIYELAVKKKRQVPKTVVALALLLGSSASLQAQETPMSLADCLRMAEEQNLTLRSGRIGVERAEQLQKTAFSLEPTSISLSQDPTSGGSPDNAVSFGQTFELPMAYASRHKLLKAETEAERQRLEVTRSELRREVSQAYFDLEFMRERMRILQRQDSIYADFLRIARAKYGAGETGRLETMNVERLCSENRVDLTAAQRDFHTAQLRLALWLNSDSTGIVPAANSMTRLTTDGLSAFDAQLHPEAEALAKVIQVSQHRVSTAKSEALPTVSVAASAQLVVKGFNPYHVDRSAFDKGDLMGFEVGVNVPLDFGSRRAKVRAAKKEAEQAALQRQQKVRTLETEYRAALNDYAKARTHLDYFDREGLQQTDEMERISRTCYENGSIGYVELIENMREALEMRMDYATAVNDCNRAVVSLRYLSEK